MECLCKRTKEARCREVRIKIEHGWSMGVKDRNLKLSGSW